MLPLSAVAKTSRRLSTPSRPTACTPRSLPVSGANRGSVWTALEHRDFTLLTEAPRTGSRASPTGDATHDNETFGLHSFQGPFPGLLAAFIVLLTSRVLEREFVLALIQIVNVRSIIAPRVKTSLYRSWRIVTLFCVERYIELRSQVTIGRAPHCYRINHQSNGAYELHLSFRNDLLSVLI